MRSAICSSFDRWKTYHHWRTGPLCMWDWNSRYLLCFVRQSAVGIAVTLTRSSPSATWPCYLSSEFRTNYLQILHKGSDCTQYYCLLPGTLLPHLPMILMNMRWWQVQRWWSYKTQSFPCNSTMLQDFINGPNTSCVYQLSERTTVAIWKYVFNFCVF